jgi:lipopolysaccharide export system protein LptA
VRTALPFCLLLAPLAVVASEAPDAPKKATAVSVLPDGSELHGVLIPRYNERRQLIGSLKAASMQLVNRERVSAKTIAIEYYDDQQPQGRIDLTEAIYDQTAGMIRADEAVKIRSNRLNADGMGLHYDIQGGDGFLIGPARTWIPAPQETAMNAPKNPLRTAALLGASVLTIATATAESPVPSPSATETAAIESRATREELAQALADSNAANAAASAFLKKAEGVDSSQAEANLPEAKPLDIVPGPADTVISCDGGMYFDPDEGVFVYLKNVTVKDPRFSLTGANELKIFLAEKPAKDGDKKDGGKKDAKKMDFGEVTRITASGALVFEQKPEDGGDPIKASGAFFSYKIKDDQVVISGGYPWVVQGGLALRARQPNLSLRIQPKSRKFQTEGQWDTILPLEQLQNNNR